MIPVVWDLMGAKSHYTTGYIGQIRCMLNGKEKTVSTFEEAIEFYKGDD